MATSRVEQVHPDLIPLGPCPKCGAPIVSTVTRTVRGVVLSDRLCASGDPVFVKWVA